MEKAQNTSSQQSQTAEEVRQQLLAHLDASKEIVSELSSEELEAVSGGGLGGLFGGGPLFGPSGDAPTSTAGGSVAANQHRTSSSTSIQQQTSSQLGNIGPINLKG